MFIICFWRKAVSNVREIKIGHHVIPLWLAVVLLISSIVLGVSSYILITLTAPSASSFSLQNQYMIEVAFPNLLFSSPIGLYHAGDGTNRLFVVEQEGVIRVFENSPNISVANVFIDITDRVLFSGEQGLLGLAFHRNFTENGYFYIDYVTDNPRRTVIARYSVSNNSANQADQSSETILLEVLQPFSNHKGGQIAFGPDGYLYIAMGDGGGAGDPQGNGQNLSALLGKILRIDVDNPSGSLNYSIPDDNPFFNNTLSYREEIYAYGLRNPWRFSFDPATGWLWVADVGQNRMEEIDIVKKGGNYGWNTMEGTLCYSPSSGCNKTGLEPPIWEYGHDVGSSITGGFVYRGSELNELYGAYVYGDYGSGRIWALRYDGVTTSMNTELADTSVNIPSFGLDQQNRLYICSFDGRIYKLAVKDITPPTIGNVVQQPPENSVHLEETVRIEVNVSDDQSGVKLVVLNYTQNESAWFILNMTNVEAGLFNATIPAMPYNANVTYIIIAEDNANNVITTQELGREYRYVVIPEFPSSLSVILSLIASFSAVMAHRRKTIRGSKE
jgi:glucose/arabinose dehydrogenase